MDLSDKLKIGGAIFYIIILIIIITVSKFALINKGANRPATISVIIFSVFLGIMTGGLFSSLKN